MNIESFKNLVISVKVIDTMGLARAGRWADFCSALEEFSDDELNVFVSTYLGEEL